jgi:hypothetical protein
VTPRRECQHLVAGGLIALALLLVAGTFLLTSIQRFGIHAARTSHDIRTSSSAGPDANQTIDRLPVLNETEMRDAPGACHGPDRAVIRQ